MRNFRVFVKQLFYGNDIQLFGKKLKGIPFVFFPRRSEKEIDGNSMKNKLRSNTEEIPCIFFHGEHINIKGNSFLKFTRGLC